MAVSVGEAVGVGLASGVRVTSGGSVGTGVAVRVAGGIGVGMNRVATAVGVSPVLVIITEPKDIYTAATPSIKPININL